MFDEIDTRYFERRAFEARQRAEHAIDPSIAKVHQSFASEYERKIDALRSSGRR